MKENLRGGKRDSQKKACAQTEVKTNQPEWFYVSGEQMRQIKATDVATRSEIPNFVLGGSMINFRNK